MAFPLGIYALQSICTFGYISLLSVVGERCAVRLRSKLFQCLIEQDIAFFDRHRTGEMINRWKSIFPCMHTQTHTHTWLNQLILYFCMHKKYAFHRLTTDWTHMLLYCLNRHVTTILNRLRVKNLLNGLFVREKYIFLILH